MYMTVYNANACLLPFTKGMVYFLKKLPVPKNNRCCFMARFAHAATQHASLTAYEGNCHSLGLYCRVQNIVCHLVRF